MLHALAAADARPNASMQATSRPSLAAGWSGRERLSSRPPRGAASPFAITALRSVSTLPIRFGAARQAERTGAQIVRRRWLLAVWPSTGAQRRVRSPW